MAKKKAGPNKVNKIKTSNFLPNVFQTNINKSWLDSTLDQMVSKGPLGQVNGYIGSKNGKHSVSSDTYVTPSVDTSLRNKTQLKPAIVSYSDNNELTNKIAFDDIVYSINQNFETYNYDASYSSSKHTFSPPINVDKFLNYKNYRWVEEMPVYESKYVTTYTNNGNVASNPLIEMQSVPAYKLTDDNNSFVLQVGMIIKFSGTGWAAEIENKTYIVTATNPETKLELYKDENGVKVYGNVVKHSSTNPGNWDKSEVVRVSPNIDNTYYKAGNLSPQLVIDAYNNDTSAGKLPIFDGFDFVGIKSNPTQFSSGTLIKFNSDWIHTDQGDNESIYITQLDATTGNVSIKKLVEATFSSGVYTLANVAGITADELALINALDQYDDNDKWDYGNISYPTKDYIVIDRADVFQTAWSRANRWVNFATINKVQELIPTYDFTEILKEYRIAQRPIIEYDVGLDLWNHAKHITPNSIGKVNYGVVSGESLTNFPIGSTYVYIDNSDTKVYKKTSTTPTVVKTLAENDTMNIESVASTSYADWNYADVYYTNSTITLAQQKIKTNQYPLYRFYDYYGVPLETIFGTGFTGEKIFGYKAGTGTFVDPEIGHILSYKDTPKGAEYEFENYLLTKEYKKSYKDAVKNQSYSKMVEGYNHIKIKNNLHTFYRPSGELTSAREEKQYEITIADTPLTIPVGTDNWRPVEEYNVIVKGNMLVLAKCNNNGTYNESHKNTRHLLGVNQTIKINNLTGYTITFKVGQVDIENPGSNPIPAITITRNGTEITIVTGANSDGDNFSIFADANEMASMSISENWDRLFYDVTINGNKVSNSLVTVGATSTVIDESAFTKGDLVDFNWVSNDKTNPTTNISFPETLEHNANNECIKTFTMSETIDHWLDKLVVNPGYSGTMFGENNYASIVHTPYYGGTMFIHPDISIMHDINYSDTNLNITATLNEQANEWYAFRKRFLAQAKRLYSIGANNSSIKLLTESAINEVIRNKKDSELYIDSNMVYSNSYDTETFTISNITIYDFKTKFNMHGDQNIRDHLYVYLTENDGNNNQVERILLKDTDYDFIGDTIYLKLTYASLDNLNTSPILKVVYNQMDSECFVPQSMVKLGLAFGMQPQVVGSTLYTHDGSTYTINGQITNVNGANFDPVHAALFDLEKRIYAGLVTQDLMYRDDSIIKDKYKTPTDYMPSHHISAWYDLATVDNYLEKFYEKWAIQNKKTSFNTENYYDVNDTFTWNYSSLSVGGKFGTNKLPGHYKGAYMTLFGTATPHLTPWHMLGYAFKPTWWDTYYSWTDATKRAALIGALNVGTVAPQAYPNKKQDIKYARRNWDFTNNCPVKPNGQLESPHNVLGTPTNADASQNFVFGDWGPVEIEWRQSALGQAMTVNAMLKLNPARAWSDYFQPGKVRDYASSYDKKYINSSCFTMPGETYKVVNEIKVATSSNLVDSEEFYILDDNESTIGTARFKTTATKISAMSMVDRGKHFTGIPILSYSTTLSVAPSIELSLKEVSFVANGISQAQHNYFKRKQLDNNQKELYKNLTTKLLQKLEGYSSQHLLSIFGETSYYGDFELGSSDYNITMYEGQSNSSVNASILLITKTPDAYTISGVADNKREFKFFEPNLSNGSNDYELQTINGATVRRYNKFVTTPSILEFGSKLSKIQDVYSFVRGYWKYLESNGYKLQYAGDSNAADFVNWTNTAEDNDIYILQIGRNLTYTPPSGYVYPYNTLSYNNNNILDMYSNKIQHSDLSINRQDGIVSVETKNQKFIGSITSATTNFEHALIFENKTALGVDLYDDVKNKRQQRLLVRGQRTQEWNGEKNAPGYLVFGDHIVENFDSAVQSVDDIYRTDVDEFNPAITKSKDLTIGNIDKDWVNGLGLNKNTITNFHQGVIKQKGTKGAVERFGRSTILDKGTTSLSAFEQYMFRQSTLGNDNLQEPFEMEIVSSDIVNLPLTISLSEVDTKKVINDVATTFETLSYDDSSSEILTGGETLTTETKYYISNSSEINVFDSTQSYATIPTWNSTTSYKKDDLVRHEGQLWKCSVNFTGLTEVAANIEEIGTVTNPVFPNGTVANIAGTTVTFNDTATEYQDIEAVGTVVSPTFLPSETLIIDGVSIGFSKSQNVTVVTGDAVMRATAGNASFADVTGKQITVNGTLINFDTTPADVSESFNADNIAPADATETNTATANQTDFTIIQNLSPATWSVLKVEVDSTIVPVSDYALNGQVVTINDPTMTGGEAVDITLTHQPLIKTAYTISQALSNTTYSVASVTIDGVLETGWTINGQVLTLNAEPTQNASVAITLTHVPDQMTTTEIMNAINNASITGLTASQVTTANLLELTFTTTDPTETLILSAGATNTDLGFPASGKVTAPPTEIQQQSVALNLTDIVSQINNTSNLFSVTASAENSQLKLTSTNTTMSVAGTARTTVGLNESYTATTSTVNVTTRMSSAISQIQSALTSANNTEVTITADANRIKITSIGQSLTLGDTDFNSIAGIATGTINAAEGTVQNVFDINQFGGAPVDPSLDPATFNILITDDSDFEISDVEGINTKFFGYNVLQVIQNHSPLYSKSVDGTHCGICAGTATSDGNDAEVTTNIDHGLQVGDFVMLLNTTTTPSINGVHKVTKLGTGSNAGRIFYIDEFIKECGNAVSIMPLVTTRFANHTQRDSALTKSHWNLPTETLVVSSNNGTTNGTFVSTTNTVGLTTVRQTIARPSNADVDSIIIYNHKTNQTKVQLEAYDPIRKIIPGIAEQNLDYSSVNDNAIYNLSTDTNRFIDDDNAWGEEQVGTRWWDTSKVRYYDYDQGSISYKKDMWGKLYPGSEIIVWEWIKSTVAPDDYAESVTLQKEMFGIPATGEAYSVYDATARETLYYYSQEQEYNPNTGTYTDVFYYWVKNKTTINGTRTLSAFDVANIIENPTANGISWFAVLDSETFIIDNVSYYVEDTSTVLQINLVGDKFKSHNEWTLITKDLDTIPEYYIEGMKYNLAGWDKNSKKIPHQTLHRFNKYGDELSIGQTWFNNLTTARRNAIITINKLLEDINLHDEYKDSWNKTLLANSFPRYLWNWKDYTLSTYLGTLNYTATVTDTDKLETDIDKDFHSVVQLPIYDSILKLDRSEIYYYNIDTATWILVHKKNSTIRFDVDLLSPSDGFDMTPWDSKGWDHTFVSEYWQVLIEALKKDIFVQYHKLKMNKLFFSVVDYTLSSFAQTNWIRKTTYVKIEVDSQIDTTSRTFKKDNLVNAIGYINEVKPFHTKISAVKTNYKVIDETSVTVTDTPTHVITLKTQDFTPTFNGTTYVGADSTDIVTGGDFTSTPTDTIEAINFLSPYNFNVNAGEKRNSFVNIDPLELLRINVQTNATGNTYANTSRTFTHIQDAAGNVKAYALLDAKKSTLTSAIDEDSTDLAIASTTAFDDTGFVYVGGEIIEYAKTDATTLKIMKRAVGQTFIVSADTGDAVVQISNYQLTFANDTVSYNQTGSSLLSTPVSEPAQELQDFGKGIEL